MGAFFYCVPSSHNLFSQLMDALMKKSTPFRMRAVDADTFCLSTLLPTRAAVAHFQCLLLIGCASLLVPSATWALDQSDPAFVGVWLFDEGEGDTVGDEVNGNDGTINGDFDWETGIIGGAIKANGGGSIDVPNSASIGTISDGLTVAAWFRIDADSDTGIRKQNAFLLEDQSATEPVPDGFSFRVWTDQGISTGFYGKTELLQGQWYHVAGTYDGTNIELYINGIPESIFGALSDVGADWPPQWSGPVGAGDPLQLKYGSESLIGAMDEVVILNRALSNEEVVQLLQGWDTLPIPEPASFSLLALGVLSLLGWRRHRR